MECLLCSSVNEVGLVSNEIFIIQKSDNFCPANAGQKLYYGSIRLIMHTRAMHHEGRNSHGTGQSMNAKKETCMYRKDPL